MQAKNPFMVLQERQLQYIDTSLLADAQYIENIVKQILADLEYLRKKSTQLCKPHTILREIQEIEQSIATHALSYIDITFNAFLSKQEKQQLKTALFKYIGHTIPYYFHKNANQSMLTFITNRLYKRQILAFFNDDAQYHWYIEDIYIGCNEKIYSTLKGHSTTIIKHLTKLKQQFSK